MKINLLLLPFLNQALSIYCHTVIFQNALFTAQFIFACTSFLFTLKNFLNISSLLFPKKSFNSVPLSNSVPFLFFTLKAPFSTVTI